ncbi:hypothetical protein PR048_032986 [Dryococelus australis]|uniref:Uncharacterized protein n=1 Tax=Dryococelus australis TaxID=614101 RepID=A0ABQ9G4I8_9NEOP|nr:hypothetical protein PR048_032986 [Dryococelus australis]
MQGWGKREISEETRQTTALFGMIPTCEYPGASPPGVETDSPRREAIPGVEMQCVVAAVRVSVRTDLPPPEGVGLPELSTGERTEGVAGSVGLPASKHSLFHVTRETQAQSDVGAATHMQHICVCAVRWRRLHWPIEFRTTMVQLGTRLSAPPEYRLFTGSRHAEHLQLSSSWAGTASLLQGSALNLPTHFPHQHNNKVTAQSPLATQRVDCPYRTSMFLGLKARRTPSALLQRAWIALIVPHVSRAQGTQNTFSSRVAGAGTASLLQGSTLNLLHTFHTNIITRAQGTQNTFSSRVLELELALELRHYSRALALNLPTHFPTNIITRVTAESPLATRAWIALILHARGLPLSYPHVSRAQGTQNTFSSRLAGAGTASLLQGSALNLPTHFPHQHNNKVTAESPLATRAWIALILHARGLPLSYPHVSRAQGTQNTFSSRLAGAGTASLLQGSALNLPTHFPPQHNNKVTAESPLATTRGLPLSAQGTQNTFSSRLAGAGTASLLQGSALNLPTHFPHQHNNKGSRHAEHLQLSSSWRWNCVTTPGLYTEPSYTLSTQHNNKVTAESHLATPRGLPLSYPHVSRAQGTQNTFSSRLAGAGTASLLQGSALNLPTHFPPPT